MIPIVWILNYFAGQKQDNNVAYTVTFVFGNTVAPTLLLVWMGL